MPAVLLRMSSMMMWTRRVMCTHSVEVAVLPLLNDDIPRDGVGV